MTEQRCIPHTEIAVSALCLGTMTFGSPVPRADAVRLVHWALDHGVNFLDTADIYEGYDRHMGSRGGVAEEVLGEALRGKRDQAVVTTKVGNPVGEGEYEGSGLGRAHMLHQIDAGLGRMQTDYVDFYELHKPDPDTPLEESIGVMAELIEAGKIRHWGFSNFEAEQIREMVRICDDNGWQRPVINQPRYNWLVRDVEAAQLPLCREHGIAVTPYRALACGLLTGKYGRDVQAPEGSRISENPAWVTLLDGGDCIPDELLDRLEAFARDAAAAGLTPAQYAVRWLLDQAGVTSVLVGVKRVAQVEALLPAVGG